MAEGGSESFSSTLAGGSEFSFDYICDPCERRGFQEEAEGYCRNCWDYLCAECYSTHLSLENHMLLDKDHMPQHPNCDLCILEGKQIDAEGFCNDCGDYLCKECFRTHLRPTPLRGHTLLNRSKMPRGLKDRPYKEKTRVEHSVDILVKSKQDATSPFITGCTVMSGKRLILVDKNNSKVKMIDLTTNLFSVELKLPKYIWDIAQVNSNQVAITAYTEMTIYCVNVKDSPALKLHVDHKVKVSGCCRGIVCAADNLIVSYDNPKKIEILRMTGEVLQTVASNEDRTQGPYIDRPYYIATDTPANIIYIADESSDRITSVSMTGKVLATFCIGTIRPYGLAVDKAGALYVCGKDPGRLIQLARDLTQMRELISNSASVNSPNSICYCDVTDRLYIGSRDCDNVVVYKLK